MKKFLPAFAASTLLFCAAQAHAQEDLSSVLPLLQAKTRTAVQNRQVLDLFAQTKDPNVAFAAGASLVRIPPAATQQARLLGILSRTDNALKQVFAAAVLTAMGTQNEALSPLLLQGVQSADPALRAYAAAAYTVLNPAENAYAQDVVNLYIYDPAFARRAMNALAASDKQTLAYLREASQSDSAQTRAAAATWLGDLQREDAAKQLLKMAKSEKDEQAASAIAVALAKNRAWTQEAVAKGLKTAYKTQPAATYALALGFMPGYAVENIKQALLSKNKNERINAARAAAYMAGVLASPDAKIYSSDTAFDASLLKSLIAPLAALSTESAAAQPYADNALKQIAKLK